MNQSHIIKNCKSIYPYVRPYRFRAILAILVTIPVGMMDTAIPWALKQYFDSLTNGNNSSINTYMPLMILAFSLLQSVFTYSATYFNVWVGAKISNGLKYDLFKKLMRCDASFFDQNTSGTIQMRFNTDVDTACNGLLSNLKMFFIRIFNTISLSIALLIISWQLAVIALIVLALALYPLTTIRKRIQNVVEDTVSSGSLIATNLIEAFSGNRIVTSYNLYNHQSEKISQSLDVAFRLGIKMVQRSGILSPIMHFVVGAGIAVIICVGSYLISHNFLTAGGFVAFVTTVIMLYQPIKSMGNDLNTIQLSMMAVERIFQILKETPKIVNKPHAIPLRSIKSTIEYRNVNFSYDSSKPILQDINITIDVGQTIALVGNSGGGKTTFVNLLPRFYDITSGQILIDGIDIRDIELDSLREKISMVFQDNFLFSGTILDNILLGKQNASAEEIDRAVKAACLDEFISTLKHGLHTKIGERGVLLSGGQKQRIAIARAFIKNAPIVILDEATSALDNKSEAIVQEAIDNLMKDRTVFVIAHRLSTVRNADNIVVINRGRIVETGTHQKLISRKDSAYSALHNVPT